MVGYIEEPAEADNRQEQEKEEEETEGGEEEKGEEKLEPVTGDRSTHDPQRRFRSTSRVVMLTNRLARGDNNLASRSRWQPEQMATLYDPDNLNPNPNGRVALASDNPGV